MSRPPFPVSFCLWLALALGTALAGCGRTLPIDPLTDGAVPDARIDAGTCRTPGDCDDRLFCTGVEACVGGRCVAGVPVVCDDMTPCTADRCDETIDSCVSEPLPTDADGDGFASTLCFGDDCDDFDPSVFPGAPELCFDGRDNDCNGLADCEDGLCAMDPSCVCVPVLENCTNGVDDDCDALADCADPQCAMDPECICVPRMEDCDNGVDDDCNLLVDCSDPICAPDPACLCMPRPEDCANMMDDDCDERIDCADTDCRMLPECCIPTMESCSNMLDDDCDMLTDCADPNCTMDPACAPPCPDMDLGSRLGDSVATGTTVGRMNRLSASCAGRALSPDIAFSWVAPRTGRYAFDTVGSSYDTALHLKAGSCTGMELACDDDAAGGLASRVIVMLTAGTSIVVVVDGFGSASAGTFVLNINQLLPEAGNCDDGVDNDRDLFIDCDDPDCAADPVCTRPCPDQDLMTAIGNAVATGTTVGQRNDNVGSCAPGSAPDVAFAWEAPVSARYRFTTAGSAYDTALYLLDGSCAGPELLCNDNSGMAVTSSVTRNVVAGTRLVIVVDGAAGASGAFRLNITPFERGFCSDMIDNDGDGSTDCADTECEDLAICCVPTPETCSNMDDDDCDRLVDCADPNCAASPACCTPTRELCSNGDDEDCDGLIDCVDPDCRTSPVC